MTHKTLMYGGTFDPVHHAHLIVARAAAEAVGADRVLLVPTAGNPLKNPPLASGTHRLEMLRLAVRHDPLFAVTDIELSRQPPSYTIDTINDLFHQHGVMDLSLLIGADMLDELPKWRRVEELLNRVKVIVACRPPRSLDEVRQTILAVESLPRPQREQLADQAIRTPLLDISSTEIRRRCAEGRPIRYLLPSAVEDYIRHQHLYERVS